MNDEEMLNKYLSGKEFLGRNGVDEDRSLGSRDGIADESLLVSPILADYVASSGTKKDATSASSQSKVTASAFTRPIQEEYSEDGGKRADNEDASVEPVNLSSELQLDESLCPSLGLGLGSEGGSVCSNTSDVRIDEEPIAEEKKGRSMCTQPEQISDAATGSVLEQDEFSSTEKHSRTPGHGSTDSVKDTDITSATSNTGTDEENFHVPTRTEIDVDRTKKANFSVAYSADDDRENEEAQNDDISANAVSASSQKQVNRQASNLLQKVKSCASDGFQEQIGSSFHTPADEELILTCKDRESGCSIDADNTQAEVDATETKITARKLPENCDSIEDHEHINIATDGISSRTFGDHEVSSIAKDCVTGSSMNKTCSGVEDEASIRKIKKGKCIEGSAATAEDEHADVAIKKSMSSHVVGDYKLKPIAKEREKRFNDCDATQENGCTDVVAKKDTLSHAFGEHELSLVAKERGNGCASNTGSTGIEEESSQFQGVDGQLFEGGGGNGDQHSDGVSGKFISLHASGNAGIEPEISEKATKEKYLENSAPTADRHIELANKDVVPFNLFGDQELSPIAKDRGTGFSSDNGGVGIRDSLVFGNHELSPIAKIQGTKFPSHNDCALIENEKSGASFRDPTAGDEKCKPKNNQETLRCSKERKQSQKADESNLDKDEKSRLSIKNDVQIPNYGTKPSLSLLLSQRNESDSDAAVAQMLLKKKHLGNLSAEAPTDVVDGKSTQETSDPTNEKCDNDKSHVCSDPAKKSLNSLVHHVSRSTSGNTTQESEKHDVVETSHPYRQQAESGSLRAESRAAVITGELLSNAESVSSEATTKSASSPTVSAGTRKRLSLDDTPTRDLWVRRPGQSLQIRTAERVRSPASRTPQSMEEEHNCPKTIRDLHSAKKKLNATSCALVERLRGAAQQRKKNLLVTRSRESLAAKEQQQLMSISSTIKTIPSGSSSKDTTPSPPLTRSRSRPRTERHGMDPYQPFKARALPPTTGDMGSGGQVGVPKVLKKPTTTPVSPKLGQRRPSNQRKSLASSSAKPSSSNQLVKSKLSYSLASKQKRNARSVPKTRQLPPEEDPYVPFKARPLPATTGEDGHGGQVGVPKVTKRCVTIPTSPRLGMKHNIGESRCMSAASSSHERSSKHMSKPKHHPPAVHKKTRNLKHQKAVTKTALEAQPFQRVLSGNAASRAKERALSEKKEHEEAQARKLAEFRARPLPRSATKPPSSIGSPVLLGLELLKEGPRSRLHAADGEENRPPRSNVPCHFQPEHLSPTVSPTKKQRHAYVLRSTSRAKNRADFEERRASHEREKCKQQRKTRRSILKEKYAELEMLRKSLD